MFNDNFIPEYLVYKEFLIEQMKNKCKLKLVETDLFYDILKDNKDYFLYNKINENYNSIKILYNNDKESLACISLIKLNRYYVFQKYE